MEGRVEVHEPKPLATRVTTRGEESVEISPPFSDDALARRFTQAYGDDLKYVAKWSRWFSWNGCQWQEDDTLETYDRARASAVPPLKSAINPGRRQAS
jgi:phage/plasmid-associated DNA primase